MNSVTLLEDDNYAAQEVRIDREKRKASVLESLMSSAQRKKLGDISNLQGQAKQMNREETQQQQDLLFSSKEYAEKLQKENMTLMKALAHRNKIIELSGVEIQKLRINLRNVQEKNLQLAQANSHMLAELNTNRDRVCFSSAEVAQNELKLLQHELCCKNVLNETRKVQIEEQALPCTHDASKDKVHDMNHKDTKRKRTSRIKPSESSSVKPIQVKENATSKRKVSGVIDTTCIPEVTCQTEDDIEKGIVDNIVNKKFVLDEANPAKDSVSKRQCVRRKSTRFDVHETDQMEKLLEMDDAKETKETARLSLRRRSTRLRPEEAGPSQRFHESDEVREAIKRTRVSSILQTASFDFQEPEVTTTLNADDAGTSVNDGSRSEAVEPSESRHGTKDTNGKRRVSTRRQSKSQTATDTDGAIKDTVTDSSMRIDIVQECDVLPSTVFQEDDERESKKTRAEETVEPSESRHDTKDTNGKRRVSTRRQSTKSKSQTAAETDGAIKDTVTDPSMRINIVQECCDVLPSTVSQEEHERESKNKARAEETEGMIRRTSVGRPSRHAAEKVQSYKEVSLKVKMRRN